MPAAPGRHGLPLHPRPVALVYHEVHAGRSSALRREAALKSLSRRQKESLVRLAG
jgi:predicted GIY-YIG superfamily endonuclease